MKVLSVLNADRNRLTNIPREVRLTDEFRNQLIIICYCSRWTEELAGIGTDMQRDTEINIQANHTNRQVYTHTE